MFNSPPKPFYLSHAGGSSTLDRRLNRNRHKHHPALHQSQYEAPRSYTEEDLVYEPAGLDDRSSSGGRSGRHHRSRRPCNF